MKQDLYWNFDPTTSTLHVHFGPGPDYGDPITDDVILKRNVESDEVVGLTLLNCKAPT